MMLKKLLIIGCLLSLPLQGYGQQTDCPNSNPQANYFQTYPEKCTDYIPFINATQTYPADYPAYPGIAYESSYYSTAQVVTAVLVATAFFVVVGIALTNTPKHHGKNCHHCHSGKR